MKKILVSLLLVLVMMFTTTTVVFARSYSNVEEPVGNDTETAYLCSIVEGEVVKTPIYKYEYEYKNNLVSKETVYNYNSTSEAFELDSYIAYEYDANGNMTHYIREEYDATKNAYEFDDEETKEYTSFNKVAKRSSYEVEDGQKYINYERVYTYNANQQLTLETFSRRENPTAELVLSNKTEYEYTNGYCTKETSYARGNFGDLLITEIAEFTYDANGNRLTQFFDSKSAGETYSYSQIITEYDNQNRPVKYTNYSQYTNLQTINVQEKNKTEYSYDGDTVTKTGYKKISDGVYEPTSRQIETIRTGYYQEEYYDWDDDEEQFLIDSGDREKVIYENGRIVACEKYEYDTSEKDYVIYSIREFTYPVVPQTPNKGNAGVVILIIILVLILLFVGAYIVWKLELEGKLKLKENDRIMKFADVVFKPIDNFLFTKVFKKENK